MQAIYVPEGRRGNYKTSWTDNADIIFEAPINVSLSGTISVQSLTKEIKAHNFVYDDAVPYLDLSDCSLDEDVTQDDLQEIADQGTIIFLPDGTGFSGTNIVADGRTPKLILRDSTDFAAPYDFTADELIHQRRFKASGTDATTMCLPYALDELPQGMKAYSLTCQDADGNAVFAEVETLEANKPYLVTATQTIDGLFLSNVLVKATPTEMPDAGCEGLAFKGALSKVSHNDAADEEAYVLGAGRQWLSVYDADEDVYVPAGRAWLIPTDGATVATFGTVLKTTSPVDYVEGDVNGDGQITAQDASLVLQIVAKKIEKGAEGVSFEAADVNGDGQITAQDASLILQLVAGKIKGFSSGE